MFANYESLVYLKRIKLIPDPKKKDELIGYCIRLVFKHHFGEGVDGLNFLEDFAVKSCLTYFYTRELNILNFMKLYMKDYTLMQDTNMVGKISVNINNFAMDIEELFTLYCKD